MANKRPKPEEIVTKLRQVEVLTGQGMARLDAIRQIGVTEQTFYRWKKKHGGMGTDQLKEQRWFGLSEQFRAVSQVDFPLGYAATEIGFGLIWYA